jgi:hypothetical protein
VKYFLLDGREFYCKGRFVKVCGLYSAWYEAIDDPEILIKSLKKSKESPHIFTFFQRVPHVIPKYNYHMEPYSVAVIKLTTYEDWWKNSIGKKTRQAVNKSQKNDIEVRISDFDDKLVKGISSIYNETPVRQGRRFPHYKDSLEKIHREKVTFIDRSVFLGAYWQNELVGFAKIVFEDEFADVLQFLSKISCRDKQVNNALMAKVVELCTMRGAGYLAYGDLVSGGLDDFKRHNGFLRMDLPRYFIPLNWTGKLALRLNLHRSVSEILPQRVVPHLKGLRRQWHDLIARYYR